MSYINDVLALRFGYLVAIRTLSSFLTCISLSVCSFSIYKTVYSLHTCQNGAHKDRLSEDPIKIFKKSEQRDKRRTENTQMLVFSDFYHGEHHTDLND